MNRTEIHSKLHYFLGLLIAFTLPFRILTPAIIGLLLVNWLIEGGLKEKFKRIINNRYALLFISLYLIHIIGLLYTSNIKAGWFDLEVKLSLFLFPLIISGKPYSKEKITHFFIALIIGLVYSSLYLLSRSISIYFTSGENTFFYQKFTVFVHPSYLSMYMNIVICWILLNLFGKNSKHYNISKFIAILLITFFVVMIILLASKSGLLTLLLIFLSLIVYLTFFKKKHIIALVGVVFFVSSFFVINSYVPALKNRINNFISALTTETDTSTFNSTSIRLLIWESSNQVIKENFIVGVGTGDIKEALTKEYDERGIKNALEHNFNAHSQFYQVFIALGLVGFLIFITSLIYPLVHSIRFNSYMYTVFLIVIIINFLSESMLDTQAGVLFYSFFNSLLCFGCLNKSKST